MILAADFNSVGVQHEQFNISFLEILRLVYPYESITFLGDGSHIDAIAGGLSPENPVHFSKATIYKKRGGAREFIKAFKEYKLLKKMLLEAEANSPVTAIFIFLINPLTHFLLKQFNAINVPVYIVCHGELETLKFNKTQLNKVWGMFLLKALKTVRKNVQYIILGESIYSNLMSVLHIPGFRPIVIDHPYPFGNYNIPLKSKEKHSWTFAIVGVVTIHKYSHYFYKVAREVKEGGKNEHMKFLVCGRVYTDMTPYLNKFVVSKEVGASYTRSELNDLVSYADFIVFYYDNKNYSLCSSGAFWDAIDAGKPILFVSNDYFKYYSEKVGDIGIEFENAEALNVYIKNICQHGFDKERYNTYVRNISTLKAEYITNEKIAGSFRDQAGNLI